MWSKVLSLLFLGLAVLNVFFGILAIFVGFEHAVHTDLLLVGVCLLFTGALYLYVAHGLRKGATWAWIVGVMVLAFNIATSLLLSSIGTALAFAFLLALMVVAAPQYGVGLELEKHAIAGKGRRFVVRKKE